MSTIADRLLLLLHLAVLHLGLRLKPAAHSSDRLLSSRNSAGPAVPTATHPRIRMRLALCQIAVRPPCTAAADPAPHAIWLAVPCKICLANLRAFHQAPSQCYAADCKQRMLRDMTSDAS